MTVRELVEAQAAARPDSTYFIAAETGETLTFRELAEGNRRIAGMLARHGLKPGAHVSVVMPNGLATLRILLGAMASGYCVNPVNLAVAAGADALRARPFRLRAWCSSSPEWAQRVRDARAGHRPRDRGASWPIRMPRACG